LRWRGGRFGSDLVLEAPLPHEICESMNRTVQTLKNAVIALKSDTGRTGVTAGVRHRLTVQGASHPREDPAMQRYRLFAVLGFLFAFNLAYSDAPALAATPAFTFTASNVTMSSTASSGVGSSSVTLTSVNGYTGTVGVNCNAPAPPTGTKVPICDFGGPAWQLIDPLTANQTVTGTIVFRNSNPVCSTPPAASQGAPNCE